MLLDLNIASTRDELNAPPLLGDVEVDLPTLCVGVLAQDGEITQLMIQAAVHLVLKDRFHEIFLTTLLHRPLLEYGRVK